jgi:Uncharacterized conserved protein
VKTYFADLHVHIGQAEGQAVKITASRDLQLKTLLYRDAPRKGLDIVGVVDAACTPVEREITELVRQGDLQELAAGGFLARNGVLLIAAAEVESSEGVHSLIYMPSLDSIHRYQKYIRSRVKKPLLIDSKSVRQDQRAHQSEPHTRRDILPGPRLHTPQGGLRLLYSQPGGSAGAGFCLP